MIETPTSGFGPHKIRPTPIGWAVLIGGALVLFKGFDTSAQTLGGVIALGIVCLFDAALSYLDLRATSIDVSPARTVGAPEQPPTARAHHAKGKKRVLIRLHPVHVTTLKKYKVEPEHLAIAPGETKVLSWDGGHPIAAVQFAWDLTTSRIGLFKVSRSQYQAVPGLVHVGPGLPQKPVDLPAVISKDDLAILREYLPGDRMSRVNWAATARTSTLHVRDTGGTDEEVLVLLVMSPTATSLEAHIEELIAMLEDARSLCEAILDLGRPLRLITTEAPDLLKRLGYERARLIQKKLPDPGSLFVHPIFVDEPVADKAELLKRLAKAESTIDDEGWARLGVNKPIIAVVGEPPVSHAHIRVSFTGIEVR